MSSVTPLSIPEPAVDDSSSWHPPPPVAAGLQDEAPGTTASLLKRVNKTSLALKSDNDDANDRFVSGIVHAIKTSSAGGGGGGGGGTGGGEERHAFAWLENSSDVASTKALMDHLRGMGYRHGSMRFIPFSSVEKWTSRYPHAAPTYVCGADGKVVRRAGGGGTDDGGMGGGDDASDEDGGALGRKKRRREKDAGSSSSSSQSTHGNGRNRIGIGTATKAGRAPPRLVVDGILPNAERDELHNIMHAYLSWLHDGLSGLETHQAGRRKVRSAGVSVPALRSLIAKMEGTFKSIKSTYSSSSSSSSSAQSSSTGGGWMTMEGGGGGGGGGDGGVPDLPPLVLQPGSGDDVVVDSNSSATTNDGDGRPEKPPPPSREIPFLERALEAELRRRVAESLNPPPPASAEGGGGGGGEGGGEVATSSKKNSSSSLSSSPSRLNDKGRPSRRRVDFEVLYRKLVQFREENGHACPTLKHPELGWWVSELRARRKALREMGLEYEPPSKSGDGGEEANVDNDDNSAAEGTTGVAGPFAMETTNAQPSPKKKGKNNKVKPAAMCNTYLSEERVRLLDDISFVWWALPERVTWEQRLEELRAFREANGRFPTNKEGTLGNWLKGQRKLYTKKDADFMANRCARLEEVGVPLRQRKYSALSWEDRFQQLVEFVRVNRHFNVPNPPPNSSDPQDDDPTSEVADARRFYKFVVKLNTDYRALQRGVPSTILTEDRIAQLRNIGFEFSTKPAYKMVPDIDWPTRLQQLEAFRSEMGHMKIDPNYDKYHNIGGWAVEMSERYKAWQEGREYPPPDEIAKFDQLISLGFGFDVFPSGRGERSWEDSFELLLQYRHATGTTRVPHHYKADFRLGSWVAVQRKEYKLCMEGKSSRLTQEKILRLESVGFEWAVRRGQDD